MLIIYCKILGKIGATLIFLLVEGPRYGNTNRGSSTSLSYCH